MRMPFKIALGLTLAVAIACFELIDVIPPSSLTADRMHGVKYRVWQYALVHGNLPARLTELPPRPGYDSSTNDGWGYPLDYSFDASGVVTLKSIGAKKVSHGEKAARDMIGIFATRDAAGRLQGIEPEWMQYPLSTWRH